MRSANFDRHYHCGDTWSIQNGIRGLEQFAHFKRDLELQEERDRARREHEERERRMKQKRSELERLVLGFASYEYPKGRKYYESK